MKRIFCICCMVILCVTSLFGQKKEELRVLRYIPEDVQFLALVDPSVIAEWAELDLLKKLINEKKPMQKDEAKFLSDWSNGKPVLGLDPTSLAAMTISSEGGWTINFYLPVCQYGKLKKSMKKASDGKLKYHITPSNRQYFYQYVSNSTLCFANEDVCVFSIMLPALSNKGEVKLGEAVVEEVTEDMESDEVVVEEVPAGEEILFDDMAIAEPEWDESHVFFIMDKMDACYSQTSFLRSPHVGEMFNIMHGVACFCDYPRLWELLKYDLGIGSDWGDFYFSPVVCDLTFSQQDIHLAAHEVNEGALSQSFSDFWKPSAPVPEELFSKSVYDPSLVVFFQVPEELPISETHQRDHNVEAFLSLQRELAGHPCFLSVNSDLNKVGFATMHSNPQQLARSFKTLLSREPDSLYGNVYYQTSHTSYSSWKGCDRYDIELISVEIRKVKYYEDKEVFFWDDEETQSGYVYWSDEYERQYVPADSVREETVQDTLSEESIILLGKDGYCFFASDEDVAEDFLLQSEPNAFQREAYEHRNDLAFMVGEIPDSMYLFDGNVGTIRSVWSRDGNRDYQLRVKENGHNLLYRLLKGLINR